jgi:hypothetical protein
MTPDGQIQGGGIAVDNIAVPPFWQTEPLQFDAGLNPC